MMMPGSKSHTKNIKIAGKAIREAKRVLILLHGRGGTAEDMLSLAQYFPVKDFALMAPCATNHTWYPYSFIAPREQNEPWLSSALTVLKETVEDAVHAGIAEENIFFLGFSQGACLMLEYIARNAARYGGAIGFSGGLIGDKIYAAHYKGDFKGMPVFIGGSDPDFHVPVERVYATTNILKEMHAAVKEKIYPDMGHSIIRDEIDQANEWIFSSYK